MRPDLRDPLIGTLAYAVRIAGVRTRRIAVSFSLFNVLVLVFAASTGGAIDPIPPSAASTSASL